MTERGMPTHHYAMTVRVKSGDKLDPMELMLEAFRGRVEHIEIEPLGDDEEED
jgi:hypothetical protein